MKSGPRILSLCLTGREGPRALELARALAERLQERDLFIRFTEPGTGASRKGEEGVLFFSPLALPHLPPGPAMGLVGWDGDDSLQFDRPPAGVRPAALFTPPGREGEVVLPAGFPPPIAAPVGCDERLFFPRPPRRPGRPLRLLLAPPPGLERKGIAWGLALLDSLEAEGLSCRVHLATPAPPGIDPALRARLRVEAEGAGPGERAELLRGMDLLLLACPGEEGRFASLPYEALAAGVPLVLPDLPLFTGLRRAGAALTYPPGAAAAAAAALAGLARQGNRRNELRERGFTLAAGHTLVRLTNTLLEALAEVWTDAPREDDYGLLIPLAREGKVAQIGPARAAGTRILAGVARQVTLACTAGPAREEELADLDNLRLGRGGRGPWGLETAAFDLVVDLDIQKNANHERRLAAGANLLRPGGVHVCPVGAEEAAKRIFGTVKPIGRRLLLCAEPVSVVPGPAGEGWKKKERTMNEDQGWRNMQQSWDPQEQDANRGAAAPLPVPPGPAGQPAGAGTGIPRPSVQGARVQTPRPASPAGPAAGTGSGPGTALPRPGGAPAAQTGWIPSWSTPAGDPPAPAGEGGPGWTPSWAQPGSNPAPTQLPDPEAPARPDAQEGEVHTMVEKLERNVSSVHNLAAQALSSIGDYKRALEHSSCAVMFDGRNPEVLNTYGWLQYLEGEDEKALAAFTDALHTDPANGDVLYNRGMVHYSCSRREEAAADWEQAIRQGYGTAEAYNNLGVIRFDQQRIDEARELFQSALQVDSNYGEARDNLAACQVRG